MLSLYLMRHGDAEAGHGKPDYMRALTPRGVSEAISQGRRLLKMAPNISRALHSPYKRANQTADLVNDILGDLPISSCEHLVPSGKVSMVLNAISGLEENILLVCHLPIIAEIAMALTGADLPFHPATIAHITRENAFAQSGKLAWIQHP